MWLRNGSNKVKWLRLMRHSLMIQSCFLFIHIGNVIETKFHRDWLSNFFFLRRVLWILLNGFHLPSSFVVIHKQLLVHSNVFFSCKVHIQFSLDIFDDIWVCGVIYKPPSCFVTLLACSWTLWQNCWNPFPALGLYQILLCVVSFGFGLGDVVAAIVFNRSNSMIMESIRIR